MDAHGHKSCCPEGSWPALKVDYVPKGKIFQLQGVDVYHVGESNRVLVVFSDIFGITSGRHQSVADTWAGFGYSVYIPQYLPEPFVEGSGNILQMIKELQWDKLETRFKYFHDYLIDKGIKEFYGIGFCYGVYAGFKLSTKFPGFKGFVGYHPSLNACGFYGENETELVDKVPCPALFLPAHNDPANIKEGGDHVQLMKKKFGDDKVTTHEFKQQVHGWVVRGDITQPAVHRDVELALKLGKEYLAKL